MKRPLLKAVVAVILLGGGLTVAALIMKTADDTSPASEPAPPPLVRVITLTPRDVTLDVASQGTVMPVTESVLSPQVAGRVEWVSPMLRAGSFFDAGEPLLRIDPRDYELAIVRAEAAVAQADMRVAGEESEARVARQEWDLIGDGEADPLVLRVPQLAEARAAARAARAERQRAQIDLARSEVQAPYDGRVLSRDVDVGQYVMPSTVLGRLMAIDRAEVRLPVPDAELAFLKLPMGRPDRDGLATMPTVTLTTEFAGQRWSWPARIVRTEAQIETRTRMLNLVAEVEHPYGDDGSGRPPLESGLFVQATIGGRTVRGAFVIPRSSLLAGDRVIVVDADDRLRLRAVEVLRAGREHAILTGGLTRDDRVCVSMLEIATDGMQVRVQVEADVR